MRRLLRSSSTMPNALAPIGRKRRSCAGDTPDTRASCRSPAGLEPKGFSLIELMVALVLGLLVMQGVLYLFSETNRVNSYQVALSRLQENGRIALSVIGDDLRRAGSMPCGSRVRPEIFVDALASHVVGRPGTANAPAGWPNGTPYLLDRGIFASGNSCVGNVCNPAIAAGEGIPSAGLSDGSRVPGTDVLTVRFLRGSGWAVDGGSSPPSCPSGAPLGAFLIRKLPGDDMPSAFDPSHVALLATCSAAQVLAVVPHGNTLLPIEQNLGAPKCASTDAQARVFDLDAQLQTSSYYLEVKARPDSNGRMASVLMQRVNGIANELVEGVERLDFRYSLVDAAGAAYWLTAAHVTASTAEDGTALSCTNAADGSVQACSWADVEAVDVSMLVNTVADLPANAAADAWNYRYVPDGDDWQSPRVEMPATGLPVGRMLRREFHSIVALRSLGS